VPFKPIKKKSNDSTKAIKVQKIKSESGRTTHAGFFFLAVSQNDICFCALKMERSIMERRKTGK
jgi:hypothetical protein